MKCEKQVPRYLLAILAFVLSGFASVSAGFEEEYEKQPWQELEHQLPAAPKKESLLPFYVSAATDNLFFIDSDSLSVDADGVVRFVLVIETSGGARNVSFEGMRCESRERRIYASGRRDGTWSKSRRNEWIPLRDAVANRHYAALYFDYFCPSGIIAGSADVVVRALRGGYPESQRW